MNRTFSLIAAALICSLPTLAQPLATNEGQRTTHIRPSHHTNRLPGVNERRLERLEKMRLSNTARRHQQGPFRAGAMSGTKKGIVLLVQFSDTKMKSNAATNWNNRFNQQGFSLDNHIGSVRDYFINQSYGQLTIDFDVVGPLTVSKTHDYYGTAPNDNLDDRAAEMVIEALKLADSQVNFKDYDWDGDGEVDQVYVIYAGTTDSDNTGNGDIWPHEWSLYSANYYGVGSGYQEMDGVYIDTYAVSNELETSTQLTGIGTACHEFSHCLGYPDFYDADYSGGTACQYWDVLDGGCYNGPEECGEVPCPYTAYERWAAGWMDLTELTDPALIKDMPCINEEGVAYKITNSGNANEYYILENRQQVTYGTYNFGHGLMVWHVDYNAEAWYNNEVNTTKSHQRYTFLPADGKVGTLYNNGGYYYYNVTIEDEAGDPYPGSQGVTSVKQLTWFTAEKNGTKTHTNLIHDIQESADGKISFTYGDYVALPAPEIAAPAAYGDNYFTACWLPVEEATSYNLEVMAMTGEAAPSPILTEDFAGFAKAANNTQVGSAVFNSYTQTSGWDVAYCYGFGDAGVRVTSSKNIGYVTTPVLGNAAGTLVVDFDAAYYGSDNCSVVVSVLDGSTTVETQNVALTATSAPYSITFENAPAGAKVKFASTAKSKRFYLYSLTVSDMSGNGGKSTIINGITDTQYTVTPLEADSYQYRVQAVSEDGNSVWSDWMLVDDLDAVAAPAGSCAAAPLYDLSGRQLMRLPAHGIYIQGGRKFIAR